MQPGRFFALWFTVAVLSGCDGDRRLPIFQAIPSTDPIGVEVLERRGSDTDLPGFVADSAIVYWMQTKRYNCFFVESDPDANFLYEDHPGEPLYCFDKGTDQFVVEI